MAAPLAAAAKLLVKPVLNQLKKAAIAKAAESGAAKAAGLSVREISKLTNLDVLNLVRAKAVKGTKAEVAKSLGISVKQLNATIADITLTETRKNAVKGSNYIKNANRFLKNPTKTIKGQGQRVLTSKLNESLREAMNKGKEVVDEDKGKYQRVLLDMLQAELLDQAPVLRLPDYLWDEAEDLRVEYIEDVRKQVELDQFYEDKAGYWWCMVATENGGPGGGFGNLIAWPIYLDHIVNLIRTGTDEIKHDGGTL